MNKIRISYGDKFVEASFTFPEDAQKVILEFEAAKLVRRMFSDHLSDVWEMQRKLLDMEALIFDMIDMLPYNSQVIARQLLQDVHTKKDD